MDVSNSYSRRWLVAGVTAVVILAGPSLALRAQDCDNNGWSDSFDLAMGDCNENGIPDVCDVFPIRLSRLQPDVDLTATPGAAMTVVDLEPDGDQDLAMICEYLDPAGFLWHVLPYLNDGNGRFSPGQARAVGPPSVAIVAARLNGDNIPDLVTLSLWGSTANGYGWVSVFLGAGLGTFHAAVDYAARPTTGPGSDGINPTAMCAEDVDGDGDIDLIAAGEDRASSDQRGLLVILLNDSNVHFTAAAAYAVGRGVQDLVCADLNGDHHPDLATANSLSQDVSILFNNGAGAFALMAHCPVSGGANHLAAADMDGDGDRDLAVTRGTPGGVCLLRNNGQGVFSGLESMGNGASTELLEAGDYDGDGHIDLVASLVLWRDLLVLLNDGTGHFSRQYRIDLGPRARVMRAGHLTADGRLDLSLVTWGSIGQSPFLSIVTSTPSPSQDANHDLVPDECVVAPTTLTIHPQRGGDTGMVTVQITGGLFTGGMTLHLARAGQANIVGDHVQIAADSQSMVARFSLIGAARGAWDVVIVAPSSTRVLPGAFTVEEGRGSVPWSQILGRTTIRLGVWDYFVVEYGNTGNTDAEVMPLEISGLPPDAELSFETPLASPPPPVQENGAPAIDWNDVPVPIQSTGETKLPLLISPVPPGYTGRFVFRMNSATPGEYRMSTRIGLSRLNALVPDSLRECLQAIAATVMDLMSVIPGLSCVESLGVSATSATNTLVGATLQPPGPDGGGPSVFSTVQTLTSLVSSSLTVVSGCMGELPVLSIVVSGVTAVLDARTALSACRSWTDTQEDAVFDYAVGGSMDPNEKVGPTGGGHGGYISPTRPMSYMISFENAATASLPAAQVVVTDQIDTIHLDPASLSFGAITVGSRLVQLQNEQGGEHRAVMDLRPETNLLVQITAGLDLQTGVVTWRFQSIDPVTNQPPADPTLGFLPPNVNAPAGQGMVTCTLTPRQDLLTGTQLRNSATIVFDVNPPIITSEWLNTIDDSLPVSHVEPLPATSGSTLNLLWSGTDDGCGIADYTVYVSENGGAFTAWRTHTTGTSASYEGQIDHTYAFYTVARDCAGHVEVKSAVAETQTTVSADPAEANRASDPPGPCGAGCAPLAMLPIMLTLIGLRSLKRQRWW